MAKKLSVGFRMFIVFAGVWTVGSINHIYFNFPKKESEESIKLMSEVQYHLAKGKKDTDIPDIEEQYKIYLREYHKERRNVIFLFLLYWLAPVGLVYVSGRCVGWIIRGFRKNKE